MRSKLFTALGLAATFGCLPTYEPAAPAQQVEQGPQRSTDQTSSAPTAVRPLQPGDGSSVFLDSEDASLLLDRIADEGPPEVASRLHSCMKVKFDTIGRVLQSRGANLATLPVTTATNCMTLATSTNATARAALSQSAAYVYCDSRGTLGLPQYGARLAEPMVQTTASSTKMHELFLAAAPEIIARFAAATPATLPACVYQGQVPQLFDGQNLCNLLGVTCLLGYVPGPDILTLCDDMVQSAEATAPTAAIPAVTAKAATATTPAVLAVPAIPATLGVDAVTTGKRIAVAALLAAAHMCE